MGRRRTPPRGCLDLHHERYDDSRPAAGTQRGGAHPPQGRAGLPQPDAVRIGGPRRLFPAAAQVGEQD